MKHDDDTPPSSGGGHYQSRLAGLIVTVLSTVFVLSLIWLLYNHTRTLQPLAESTFLPNDLFVGCTDRGCIELLVEQEIQRFRALRVESALMYRNEVQVATLIVGLAMTVLGAVLIFDRVKSEEDSILALENGQRAKLVMASTFPGLMLCALGALVLMMNVYATTSGKTPIQVQEGRVLSTFAQPLDGRLERAN